MSSLNKVRLPDGTELNISEWLHWPLYSSVDIGATDSIQLDAFSYVVGNQVPRSPNAPAARLATRLDTNLVRARKMNQDEALVVFAITWELFGYDGTTDPNSPSQPMAATPLVDPVDLRTLQRDLLVELKVGANIKKPQVGIPFEYIGQGIGRAEYVSGDAASVATGSGGYPTPQNQRVLNLPVYIGGFGESAKPGNSMTFFLRVRTPNGASTLPALKQDYAMRWWLDGLKKRPA